MIDRRTFLTALVCAAIFLIWTQFIAPPEQKKPTGAASQPVKTAEQPATAPASPASLIAAGEPEAPERTERLSSPKVDLELSSHGAALTKVTLKEYREGGIKRSEQKHPVSLIGEAKGQRVDGVAVLLGGAPVIFSDIQRSDRGVVFSGTQQGLDTRASWTIGQNDYVLDLVFEVKNTSEAELSIAPGLALSGVFNEKIIKDKSMFEPPPDLIAPAAYIDGQLYKHEHEKKDSPPAATNLAWAGIDKQYFLLAAAPVETQVASAQFEEKKLPGDRLLMAARLAQADKKLAPGEAAAFRYTVYAGPKASRYLKAPGRQFEEAVDYKVWFMPLGFLSRPMLWILNQAHAVVHSYGWAILILTLIVKLLLLPVTQKSFMSMQVMRDLKPELDKIKTRFPDDREKQGLATMQLYKERGVNPFLSGCLPALLQMPVYLALWRTLWAAVELYQQEFLWLGDLTAKDPYYILPLMLGATMFAQQKLSPPMGDPQQQKIMLYMMPPLMTFFMVGLPSGLVFYIFVNTILTILQQAYINRKFGKKTALRPAT
jgi:YidC/Oxa1 family membrane protein insertase